jgi:hypothetical protein
MGMSINWYNVVGLVLEMVGIIMIWIFSKKITGMTTPADIQFSGYSWWFQIGIMLIVFGVASQLAGNFLG